MYIFKGRVKLNLFGMVCWYPPISDPRVRFWDADFGPLEGGHLFGRYLQCKIKDNGLKIEGGHVLGRSFRAFPPGQLFGHGYASGRGSLIRGWVN
jgi:hypothetical protein